MAAKPEGDACIFHLGADDCLDDKLRKPAVVSGAGALRDLRSLYFAAVRVATQVGFFVVLFASVICSMAPLALALLDATWHCVLLATRGKVVADGGPALSRLASAGLHAHPDTLVREVRGFHFRTSAEDVAALAVLRATMAVLAWSVFSSRANLYRPFLMTSYASAAAAALLVAVKAPQYRYASARGPIWLAPMLFGTSLAAALGYVALASHAAAASRRRRCHLEACSSLEECWALPGGTPIAASSRPAAAAAHRRRQSREDIEASLREAGDADMQDVSSLAGADSCFAEVEGLVVHYKHLAPGPGDVADTAVLLIHAFGGGEHSWRYAAPLLARRCRSRVIAFDRTGFGLSARPTHDGGSVADSPYSLHANARCAVALCRALGVRRVVLVGHADGCTLALLVASLLRQQQPDDAAAVRCAGVALLAPNATGEVVPTSTRLLLKSSVSLPLLRPLLRSELGVAALRRAFACPTKITPALLSRYTEPTRVVGWDRALWEVARCAGEVPPAELAALAEAAAAARTAALVVGGTQDRLSPPEVAAHWARCLGGSVILLPECGHLPHEEAPAALVAVLAPAVTAWLAAPPASTALAPDDATPLPDVSPASA